MTEDLSAKRLSPGDRHNPGRRFEDLPAELIEASRRAGSQPHDGNDDGTDRSGREQLLPAGMHEGLATRLRGKHLARLQGMPVKDRRPMTTKPWSPAKPAV